MSEFDGETRTLGKSSMGHVSAEEFQVELDDVYACPGRCPGCVLSSAERKTVQPDMSHETRRLIFDKLTSYVLGLGGLKRMNLTYGIADHFLMSSNYLEEIYQDAIRFFKEVGLSGNGAVFLTTSLIGKTEDIKGKIDALEKMSEGETPLRLIVVFDPGKYRHQSFGEKYEEHIRYAKEKFGVVDLAVNLSDEALMEISAKEMAEFAAKHGFHEVTVNWVPTQDNIKQTYSEKTKKVLVKWLEEFALLSEQRGIQSSYVPVIQKSYAAWRCAIDAESKEDGLGVLPVVEKLMENTLGKSIQFDHEGRVFAKWEAIGDVPSNERTGMAIWGEVREPKNLAEIIQKGLVTTKREAIKAVSKDVCRTCDYAALCATTGFHVYTSVIAKSHSAVSRECPHVAHHFWSAEAAKVRDESSMNL
jgi:hypothetical protein